jgi:uncharacterized protein (TIGR00251 family)
LIKYSETENGITFSVRVQPRASRSEIVGEIDGSLKIRIAAPPVDGEANAECVRFLARHFGVSKNNVEIISGLSSKNKVIRIAGIKSDQFDQLLSF